MKNFVIYVHGKGGSADEAEFYKKFFENVVGFDYKSENVWDFKEEFLKFISGKNLAEKIGAKVTVMQNGEHWFHTAEQMQFLSDWIKNL